MVIDKGIEARLRESIKDEDILEHTAAVYYFLEHMNTRERQLNQPWTNVQTSIANKRYRLRKKGIREQNFSTAVKQLEDLGIVSVNKRYSAGKFSKSYQLLIVPTTGEFTVRPQSPKALQRIRNKKEKEYRNNKELCPYYESTLYYRNLIQNRIGDIMEATSDHYRNVHQGKAQATLHVLNNILDGNIRIHKATTGRIYYPMNHIPNFLNDIIFDGLIEMDAANSQPLLLSKFIDSENYGNIVKAGLVYEDLARIFKWEGDREYYKERSFKQIFFKLSELDKNIREGLNQNYDGMGDQLNAILSKQDNLWYKLQNLEAKIWIPVAKKYIRNNPEVVVKHDSILAPQHISRSILRSIKKSYRNKDLYPKIRIEQWGLSK